MPPFHLSSVLRLPSLSTKLGVSPDSFTFDRTGLRNNLTLTCLENTAMSSLNDSEEQTSPPATPGSRGVQVANSHFSKINASNGNKGCLKSKREKKQSLIDYRETVSRCGEEKKRLLHAKQVPVKDNHIKEIYNARKTLCKHRSS